MRNKRSVDLTDPENPEWTEETFARARPAVEVLSSEVLAAFGKPRGRPRAASPKVAVTLRLDPEILTVYRAEGPGWQTRLNADLRQVIDGKVKATADRKHARTR